MPFLAQHPAATFRGFGNFGRGGPEVLLPILNGQFWSTWPEQFKTGLAALITKPSAEGGGVGGLGNIENNLASMLKWFENRQREWANADIPAKLGYQLVNGKQVLA